MKAVFTRFFSVLMANTPPYRKGPSSRKFLSLFLILFLGIGQMWGADFTPQQIIDGATSGHVSVSSAIATSTSSQKVCNTNTDVVSIDGSANGNGDAKYIQIQADEDYTISSLSLDASINKTDGNTYKIGVVFFSGVYAATVTDKAEVVIANKNATSGCGPFDISVPAGTRTVRIYRAIKINGDNQFNGSGTQYGSGQNTYVAGISATAASAAVTKHTVTYELNGGTGTTPTQADVAEGTEITLAAAPTAPAGQEFAGWSDGTNTYNAGDTYTMGAAPVTFTAQWQAETTKYDVTYDLNGGTGTAPTQGKVAENGTFTVASAEGITPPAGKEFAGWSDGTNTYNAGDTYTMGAAAVTFTAQWKAAPTVIFHYQWTGSSTQPAVGDVLTGIGGTITVERKEGSEKNLSNESAKFVSSVPSDMKFTTSDSKGVKFGTSDVWFRIALNSGNFEEGDMIAICGYEAFLISSSTAFDGDISSSLSTGSNKENYEVKQCVIPSIESFPNLYIRRVSSSCGFAAIKVIRPAQKEILSTDITLSAVTVNTEAISAENLATLKEDPYKLDLTSEYAEAPTIAFTKQTVITYEDATTKTKTEAIEVVAAKVDGKWQAQAEINGVTYTVTAIVPATYTVIYKDGETELASEIVKVGEHPTAEGVESKSLYTLSWKLGEEVVELSNVNGTADQEIILTAVWTPKYATSLDFAAITTAGTTGDNPIAEFLASGNMIASNLGSSEWETSTSKSGYVGYKLKNNGATITFLAQADKRVTITFGSIAADVTLKEGDETVTISAKSGDDAETVYNLDVTTDMVVAITTSSGSTVTLKSITIGEIPDISDDATLKDLKVNGTTIAGFNSATDSYYVEMPYGTQKADLPLVTATANHAAATVIVQDAKDRPDDTRATIKVTAEDGKTIKHYYVYFTNAAKEGVTIIKATHTGEATADVIGAIGGTCDKKTQADGKLGSNGHYFGIKLAEGTFKSGDVIKVVASALNGGNTITLFADNEGTTEIGSVAYDQSTKTAYFTLTADVENVYIYRVSSACNSNVEYIEVQRYMDPFIESFEVAGVQGVVDEKNKIIAVEVSASTDVTALTPTIVAWANGGAKVTPTGAQDFTNPVTYSVASEYAEDGETEYTVTVTKAAAIKEVNITGGTDVKEDETITLSATVIDTNDAEASNQNVTWTSNDETTAIMDANGVVTGVKAGTVKITATSVADNTKSASVTITVTENPCRTWNAPAESFSGDITKGKLSIKNSGCSIGDVTPFSGASKVYAYKIDGSSDYVELSFTDKSQFETLTLGVSSGSNGSTPTFVVVASKSAVFDEETIVEIFTYNANAKDAEQSLVDVSIPEGTRNVRIYRKYNDIGSGSSVSVYYVNACKKDFVPVTTISVNNAKLGKGKSLNLKATITPANADIESLAWSIESMTATNVTILGNVLTAAENATEGEVVVKVVATDVLSNVVEATATISIVDKFEVVKPVTATQVWNWAPVAVGEGETIADPDTVLANYISGDEWEMLAGNVGGRPYRNTSYKAYQGTSLYFKAAVPGLLIMYAGSTGNDKDVFVNGTKVGTVKSNKAYMDTIAVQAGDVYITSESMRIYWMKFDTDFASYEITDNLFNGYTRDVRQGYYGTICLPNGGVMVGASIFEIAYKDASKIYFDEILNGKMKAGVPYIFLPNEGADKLTVFYTDEANASAGSKNGLVGSYTQELLEANGNNYILLNNQYCEVIGEAYVGANRAYFQLSGIPTSAPALAPGARRVSMGMAGQNTATGVDQVQGDEVPTKMIINGQLFILRGEKMYDAQGKLVK